MSHLKEFNTIVAQYLVSVGIAFDEEVQALLILAQLSESWLGTVTAVSNLVGKEKLKLRKLEIASGSGGSSSTLS